MLTVIEKFAVMLAISVLQAVIKNPKSAAEEGAVISQIAQLSTQADTMVNGTVWTSTPGTPAAIA
jgi:hypothetical protein